MSAPAVEAVPRPAWLPLSHEGCTGVESKVLLHDEALLVALLRFEAHGTIHEHAAGHPIDVVCLEGEGRTSVGADEAGLAAGQRVRWPAGVPHRLWTLGSPMTALMLERPVGE